MKAKFEISWKELRIMQINCLDLFAAAIHRAEGENTLSVRTLRSLTNLDTVIRVPDSSQGDC